MVGQLETDRQWQVTLKDVADKAGNVMLQPVVTTFWTPDTIPPQASWQTPGEGETFTSGDTIQALVQATDERGVASVHIELGEWSWTLTSEPYGLPVPAPIVAEPSDQVLSATVTDIFGNVTVVTRTIHVEPLVNVDAPEVSVDCFVDGDYVVPGRATSFKVHMSDDLSIESYGMKVDGQVHEWLTPAWVPSADPVFVWTPPADALPGQIFHLSFEARDFAANVGVLEFDVQVPPDVLLSGDQNVLGSDYAGGSLALADGVFTLEGPLSVTELRLLEGATLRGRALEVMDLQATDIGPAMRCRDRRGRSRPQRRRGPGGHRAHPGQGWWQPRWPRQGLCRWSRGRRLRQRLLPADVRCRRLGLDRLELHQ